MQQAMFWILTGLTGLIAAVDGWGCRTLFGRRAARSRRERTGRAALLLWLAATDLLLPGALLAFRLAADNPAGMMHFLSLSMLFFFAFVLPRPLFWSLLSKRRGVRTAGAIAGGLLSGAVLYGFFIGRTALRIERVEVLSEHLPEGFDGVRIAHFSDLHIGALLRPERETARIVEMIRALEPDLILFSGDLVHIRYTELDTAVMELLSRLEAPLGVYSVTGNHDTGCYVRDTLRLPPRINTARLIRRQQAAGWEVLDNTSRWLRRHGDSISLSGISFDHAWHDARHSGAIPESDLSPVYGTVPPGGFNITLSHIPQLWERITALGYGDLTLAGHVHAMQHKIPVGRRGLSLARLLYRRWSGAYTEPEGTLYINDGIGAVGLPARIGAGPEITLLTLRRPEKGKR